jgi:hypothetical protein
MPCAYAIVAFVPRLRTVQTGRHFTIVDALLARFAAEPLFGGSRWLGLDLVRLPVCTRSRRHLRYEYHRDQSNCGRAIVEDNIGASVQQQSGHCCRF